MNRVVGTGAILVVASLFVGAAHAEIGKATAQPGEWYWGVTGSAAATFGADRQVAEKRHSFDPSDDWQNVLYDDGSIWTLGLEVGHVLTDPMAWVDRVEFNLDGSITFRSAKDEEINAALAASDGNSATIFQFGSDPFGVDITGDDSQLDLEARVSFKNVVSEDDGHILLTSIEPFVRYQSTDGDGKMAFKPQFGGSSVTRDDDIEAYYVGLQAALEMEHPLSESLNLIGRASAGIYYVDSDITTEVGNSGFEPSDSDNTIGGRFGAALGFKAPLFVTGATFSIVATVDYYTDVATIKHAEQSLNGPPSETKADFDDRFDVGGRVGVIFPIH